MLSLQKYQYMMTIRSNILPKSSLLAVPLLHGVLVQARRILMSQLSAYSKRSAPVALAYQEACWDPSRTDQGALRNRLEIYSVLRHLHSRILAGLLYGSRPVHLARHPVLLGQFLCLRTSFRQQIAQPSLRSLQGV